MEFDLFTLLPLAAAIFVFWKLRSVLGTRNGTEQPPFQPPSETDMYGKNAERAEAESAGDNVVTLPSARREGAEDARKAQKERAAAIARHAGDDKALKTGMTAIASRDPDFDPDEFINGAKMAYEMIVTAFADGDKDALRGLLAKDVYDNFATAIDERHAEGLSMRSTFVGLEKTAIIGAELQRDDAHVTVDFVSQIISATLDKDDEVVDGDLAEVAEVNDVWTFARDVTERDPNWKLVATDA